MWTIRELRRRWTEIVGREWAQMTYPTCVMSDEATLMVSYDPERMSEWRTVLVAARCLDALPEGISGYHVERVQLVDALAFCRESSRS